jgi:hypothetical protein
MSERTKQQKTQRAFAYYSEAGIEPSRSDGDAVVFTTSWDSSVPVLVVPEAAVKCRHTQGVRGCVASDYPNSWLQVCITCGSWRSTEVASARWQRPRILRVGKP